MPAGEPLPLRASPCTRVRTRIAHAPFPRLYCFQRKIGGAFLLNLGFSRRCRHGERCSRLHTKPTISQTILLSNMYQSPAAQLAATGQPVDPVKMQEHYEVRWEACPHCWHRGSNGFRAFPAVHVNNPADSLRSLHARASVSITSVAVLNNLSCCSLPITGFLRGCVRGA